jgi:[ribosomal protein S5]-alanine N-acetyltransferase
MPIHTARLTLRIFTPQDYQYLRELDSNPEVLKYRSRKMIDPETTKKFLEEAQKAHKETPRRHFSYVTTLKKREIWLGQCGMTMIPSEDEKRAYLWYSLLPKYWGQGYMTEAIQALICVGINKFEIAIIEGECSLENVRSARVMERTEMQYLGVVEQENRFGKIEKRLHYEINRSNWEIKKQEEPSAIGVY